MTCPDDFPMLASAAENPNLLRMSGRYAFEPKMDGIRAAIVIHPTGMVEIYNRSRIGRTEIYPELWDTPEQLWDCVLDGEIVAMSGSFEEVAIRDKQRDGSLEGVLPVRFVAFDLLETKGVNVRLQVYAHRRLLLRNLFDQIPPSPPSRYSLIESSPDTAMIDRIKAAGGEGVVAKAESSIYVATRSPHWIKIKNTYSITAIATGYETGNGARSSFGAMYLSLLNSDNEVVPIGKVGSGFSVAAIKECKKLLDNHIPFLVEVSVANVTQSGALRFPVYRGIRTDLPITEATIDQLEAIPRT